MGYSGGPNPGQKELSKTMILILDRFGTTLVRVHKDETQNSQLIFGDQVQTFRRTL